MKHIKYLLNKTGSFISLRERLKQIRITLGYNQKEIAEKLGYELTTYRSFEYKSKNLPVEFLSALICTFSVNINWLLTGNGDMFINTKENISSKIITLNENRDNKNLFFSIEEIKTLNNIIKKINDMI